MSKELEEAKKRRDEARRAWDEARREVERLEAEEAATQQRRDE